MLQSEQIHLLRVRILSTYPPFSPPASLVIRDGRGAADAPALGAVPAMTLMTTATTAEQALMPPNTFGRFAQAVSLHSCRTFCCVAFSDQYFIFVYPLSAAITRLTVLKGGRLLVSRLLSFHIFLIKGLFFMTPTLI